MTSALRSLLVVCSLPICLLAQPAGPPYSIVGVAGVPFVLGDNGPAKSAVLRSPTFLAADGAGNLYVSENLGYRIRKITSGGVITTLAGTGAGGGGTPGAQATASTMYSPEGIALDSSGNIYFAEASVWKISSGGALVSVVGNGFGYGGDGHSASAATVNTVGGIRFDQAGNLYLADTKNNRIRRIDMSGIITTVAGNGSGGPGGDGGPATAAQLSSPNDVAVDAAGNLYIADQGNNRVRKVAPDGTISTYAGTGTSGYNGDGEDAASALLTNPAGLVFDATGRLYVSESGGFRVRRITPTAKGNVIETVAGNGTAGFQGDGGLAASAEIDTPWGLAMDSAGNLYIAEGGTSQRIRQVTPAGIISTVAGVTHFAGDGGPGTLASLAFPQSVAADGSGNLYIADTLNHRIRQLTSDGTIRTVAGNGVNAVSGNGGQAVNASLATPNRVALDSSGNLYFSDNNQVRMITPGGIISTVAGNGVPGSSGDGGPASAARLHDPQGLAVDSNNNLYIADFLNQSIRMISAKGTISTVAGTGTQGFFGDGGPATAAMLSNPVDVAVDSAGNLYIADQGNQRIRKVDTNHVITTVAGNGQNTFSGDGGPATVAGLKNVLGVKVDSANRIFITDPWNGRIRMVDSSGIITTAAGSGSRTSSGDGGLATAATLGGPIDTGYGLAIGPGGVIYFADYLGEEIRKLTPHVAAQLTILSGNNQSAAAGASLPNPLVVSVVDPAGVGVGGVAVTFTVTAGSAKLGAASTVTTSNGQAGVSVTFGAAAGPVTVTAAVSGLPSVTFNLTATMSVNMGPMISDGGVVGAGLSVPTVSQISTGAIVSIFGQNFAPAGSALRLVGGADLVNGQLPTQLGGVCVTMNGQQAAMMLVSPQQLNVQVPAAPQSGSVAVQVIANCGQTGAATSPAVTVAAQPETPEFFFFAHNANGQNPVAALNAVTGANIGTPNAIPEAVPAQPGDILSIFMTGLGATNPSYAAGVLPPTSASVSAPVTVSLGALTLLAANVQYAGVAPGNAGLYQLNIQIPSGSPTGNVPLTVTVGGISTPAGGYLTIGQ